MNLESAKIGASFALNRGMLLLRKKSPEILLASGIFSMLAGTYLAVDATLKASPEFLKLQQAFMVIDKARKENPNDYTEEECMHDKGKAAFTFFVSVGYFYWPSFVASGFGIVLLVGSHKVLSRRNAALVAAYKAIDQSFKNYRRKMTEEFGEEKESELSLASAAQLLDKDERSVDDTPACMRIGDGSIYAKWFDDSNHLWKRDRSLNAFFLKAQQNYANDLLKSQGHLFLNEVYDMLGFPRTDYGAVVGWVNGNADSYVDFGIFAPIQENRDFINGYNAPILLDFNVDGVIYDLI